MSTAEYIPSIYSEKIQGLLDQSIPYQGPLLKEKTIIPIYSAHYVGTSELIDKVIETAPKVIWNIPLNEQVLDYRKVTPVRFDTITERSVDPENPVDGEWVIDQLETGMFVTCNVSNNGILRATTYDHYPAEHSLLEATIKDMEQLGAASKQLGFKALMCVWFTIPANQWADNLDTVQNDPDFYEKLEESIDIIEYTLRSRHPEFRISQASYDAADSNMSNVARRIIALSHEDISGSNATSVISDHGPDMFNHAILRLCMRYQELNNSKPITSARPL